MDVWGFYLNNHPDQNFAKTLLNHIVSGVPIGYSGPHEYRVSPNWPSAQQFSSHVEQVLLYDVSRGRKAGPFSQPPFTNFVGSPMGAFQRKRSGKVRVIHDLSWPPGRGINAFIDEQMCTLEYITIDNVVHHVKTYGPGTLMGKLDLQDAFKHVVVRPEDWHLLGSTWVNSAGNVEYYVETVLPFGLRSAPKLFNNFANGLHFIMEHKGVTDLEHYLDDYFTCGPPGTDICKGNLNTMVESCEETGFEYNPKKLEGPATCLEVLGIVIDSMLMELRISEDRLLDTYSELQLWSTRKVCTKRQLLSLIGKLTFISRVVRSGRTFVRRMIDLSKRVKHLHFKIKLNSCFKADLDWWLSYLPSWNGVSAFSDEQWLDSEVIQLYTDASDKGIGCVFGNEWFLVEFSGRLNKFAKYNIAWRELYAVVKAAATWGHYLTGRKIIFMCDNEAIVYVINSGTSRDLSIMNLIRTLFYVGAKHQFECRSQHVLGRLNTAADAASRMELTTFRQVMPEANVSMTEPCMIY